jgi:hypothetical protein
LSTYVVYASDTITLPPPPLPKWEGLTHLWTGWDGTTFDLTEGSAGVFMLLDGVTGMHLPEFDQHLDEYASVDGGRYRGTRTRVRHPSWTIGIFGEDSRAWRDRDTAFWRTLDPDRPGLWSIRDPEGRVRTLVCRLRSSSEHTYDRDPHEAGWSVYTVDLLAEQPYWQGPPVRSPRWAHEESVDFTGPTDAAPPFYVSGASMIGEARLTNEGDVEAWLTWDVEGPVDSVQIEAAGGSLAYGSVPAGEMLRITTDPSEPVARIGTADVTGQVEPWDPRPIPPGETSEVGITLVGTGAVQARFVPRFRRAL